MPGDEFVECFQLLPDQVARGLVLQLTGLAIEFCSAVADVPKRVSVIGKRLPGASKRRLLVHTTDAIKAAKRLECRRSIGLLARHCCGVTASSLMNPAPRHRWEQIFSPASVAALEA